MELLNSLSSTKDCFCQILIVIKKFHGSSIFLATPYIIQAQNLKKQTLLKIQFYILLLDNYPNHKHLASV